MQYAVAVVLAALVAFVSLWVKGKKVDARVIYNKPTTVWPIGVVVYASMAALAMAMLLTAIDASKNVLIIGTVLTWYVVAATGRIITGTRLVYDRGGRTFTPSQVVTAIGFFFFLLCMFVVMATT